MPETVHSTMSQTRLSRYSQLALTTAWLLGGAIFYQNITLAQIIPDATLPVNSIVTPQGNINIIEGGTQTGSNLFHSFQEFSIPTGGTAFFNNAPDIQNIFSRVTGGNISNIDGIIRANNTANLFLLNPNGIIFGPNASLNIGGSFLASTASSLNFAASTPFSAAPTAQTTPLLTISVPIGLQFGVSPSPIQVQSSRLAVSPGKSLALVGGDVTIAGGNLFAEGGRIDLGSVGNNSNVGISLIGNIPIINYSGVQNFANLQLSQQANIDSSDIGAGDIQLVGGRVTLTENSNISANTLGDTANATLRERNSGNINIQASQLTLQDGATVSAYTFGSGNGGSVTVNAADSIELIGTNNKISLVNFVLGTVNASDFSNGIFTGSLDDATGRSGDLTINTGRLTIQNGAAAIAFTAGRGAGGNLIVNARESIDLIGTGTRSPLFGISDDFPISLPDVLNGIATASVGNGKEAGNLTINTGRLTIQNAAAVLSATTGNGRGGNLTVNAGELVEIKNKSGLATATILNSGNAGDLTIISPRLTLEQNSVISSSTFGAGNAGDMLIETRQLVARETATITASTGLPNLPLTLGTDSTGKGGNLTVNASESIELSNRSALLSQTSGAGNGGNVTINTGRLIIDGNRSGASTAVAGSGKGGDLTVNADEFIEITGSFPGAFTVTEEVVFLIFGTQGERSRFAGLATVSQGAGDAGNLTINTPHFTARDGAGAITSAANTGAGGNMTVNALESINLSGRSALATATLGTNKAGNLTINTSRLNVENGAAISADTLGAGNAGTLNINTQQLTVQSGSRIGAGTTESSTGLGGKVTINATDSVELIGTSADGTVPSEVVASTLGKGNAGDLIIQTGNLTIRDGARVTVSGEGVGAAGNLDAIANTLLLDNQSSLNAETAAGDRGNITLQIPFVQMRNGSRITTNATGSANGGNITINSDILASLENSDILAQAIRGRGGNININTQGILQSFDSNIDASSQLGIDGVVDIQTPDIDPTQGLLKLPQNPANPTIVRGCEAASRQASRFVNIGLGGLPPNPTQPLNNYSIWLNSNNIDKPNLPTSHSPLPTPQMIEAQGWIRGANGEIILTAEAPKVTPYSSLPTPYSCHVQ